MDATEASFIDRVERLAAAGRIDRRVQSELLGPKLGRAHPGKTEEDVEFLMSLVRRYRSVEYARGIAARRARRARATLELLARRWVPSVHLEFLKGIADFVVERER